MRKPIEPEDGPAIILLDRDKVFDKQLASADLSRTYFHAGSDKYANSYGK